MRLETRTQDLFYYVLSIIKFSNKFDSFRAQYNRLLIFIEVLLPIKPAILELRLETLKEVVNSYISAVSLIYTVSFRYIF